MAQAVALAQNALTSVSVLSCYSRLYSHPDWMGVPAPYTSRWYECCRGKDKEGGGTGSGLRRVIVSFNTAIPAMLGWRYRACRKVLHLPGQLKRSD